MDTTPHQRLTDGLSVLVALGFLEKSRALAMLQDFRELPDEADEPLLRAIRQDLGLPADYWPGDPIHEHA